MEKLNMPYGVFEGERPRPHYEPKDIINHPEVLALYMQGFSCLFRFSGALHLSTYRRAIGKLPQGHSPIKLLDLYRNAPENPVANCKCSDWHMFVKCNKAGGCDLSQFWAIEQELTASAVLELDRVN